jgi:hypothetical protein
MYTEFRTEVVDKEGSELSTAVVDLTAVSVASDLPYKIARMPVSTFLSWRSVRDYVDP